MEDYHFKAKPKVQFVSVNFAHLANKNSAHPWIVRRVNTCAGGKNSSIMHITIFFSPKNLSKKAAPLIFKRNDVILKQHNFVEYLGCLFDNTLSGKDMAEKVLEK